MIKTITVFIIINFVIIVLAFADNTNQIPNLINYQGVLTDENGAGIFGIKKIEFRLYDKMIGGQEIWGPQIFESVTVVNGQFNVILGDKDINNRLIVNAFDSGDRYLGIKFGNTGDDSNRLVEISPRQKILTIPYAINALSSLNAKNAENAENAESANTVQNEKIYVNPDNGNVGIGNVKPSARLHVSGNIIAYTPTAENHVTTKDYVDNKWPDGHYCIFQAGGSCPSGFTGGEIIFDTEDNRNEDSCHGSYGDSGKVNTMSGIKLKLCCK